MASGKQTEIELVGGPLDGAVEWVWDYCGVLWVRGRYPISHRYDDSGRRSARGMRVFVYVETKGPKQCPK